MKLAYAIVMTLILIAAIVITVKDAMAFGIFCGLLFLGEGVEHGLRNFGRGRDFDEQSK